MNFRALWRILGPWDTLLYAASRVLDRLARGRVRLVKYYFVAQPIGRPDAKPMRADAATQIVGVAATHPLRAAFPRPAAVLDRRYADGAECTAALLRGDFAGFIWIQRGKYDEDEVRCCYRLAEPQQCVWDYDVYVEPRFRTGRTLARLWRHVDDELARQGVRWSFSRISAFNPASLGSHARLGTVGCGSALFLCAGPAQVALMPHFPWLHGSWGPGSAPEVRFRLPD